MKDLYAGTLVEKRDIASYNDDGDTVLNLVVKTSKTIVLFRGEADRADAELKVGDNIVLSEVARSPRIYRTTKGSTVETVDMIAESFVIVPPREFKTSLSELTKMSLTEEDLVFTDADRLACESATAKDAPEDTDLDDVF